MPRSRCILLPLPALLLSACVIDPGLPPRPVSGRPGSVDPTQCEAFAPVALRVHPLTHLDSGPDPAKCLLVLHVELRDRYEDSVKALGPLRVELRRPGDERASLTWDVIDMREPDANSLRFDPSTRSYRFPLEAPRWVLDFGKSDRAAGIDPGVLIVRAALATRAADGVERVLADEATLEQ